MHSKPKSVQEWEKEFERFLIEVTDETKWKDGKPVYDGYIYITLGNAIKQFISNLLKQRESEIKEELLKNISNESWFELNEVINKILK